MEVRLFGKTGISYSFTDKDKKQRKIRGQNLGKYFTLTEIEQSFQRKAERAERAEHRQQRQAVHAVNTGIRAIEDLAEGKVGRIFITLCGLLAIAMERQAQQQGSLGTPSINNHKEEVVKMDEKEMEILKAVHDRDWKTCPCCKSEETECIEVGFQVGFQDKQINTDLRICYSCDDLYLVCPDNVMSPPKSLPVRVPEDLREKAAKSKEDYIASKKLFERLDQLNPGEGLSLSHGKQEAGKIIPSAKSPDQTNPGDKPGQK